MKLKQGISGLENEVCRRLQSLLAYHHSIEVKPCRDAKEAANISALLHGSDFVSCTYRPDSAQYSASIQQAIFAGIPVLLFADA